VEKTYGFPLTEIMVESAAMQLQPGDTKQTCIEFIMEYADLDMVAFEQQEAALAEANGGVTGKGDYEGAA